MPTLHRCTAPLAATSVPSGVPLGERAPLLPTAAWNAVPAAGFGGLFSGGLRRAPPPAVPRLLLTPPSPLPRPVCLASPSRHVAAQAYAALGSYGLSFTAAALVGDPRGLQYRLLGAASLLALATAAGLVQGGWVGRRAWSWSLLGTGIAHASVLGTALGPLVCGARAAVAGPAGPEGFCPTPGPGTPTYLVAGTAATALWGAANCLHWRDVAGELRAGTGSGGASTNHLTWPLGAAASLFAAVGVLALGFGLSCDDGALTGLGCLVLLGSPALVTPALTAARRRTRD